MTTHQLILKTLGELREENPLMSQVTDVWYDKTKKGYDRPLILVYKGSIYQTNLDIYGYAPEEKPKAVRDAFEEMFELITKHEEEGRFNRLRLDHLYPGLAS